MPTALISGITGQDGSYLTEFLLDKGYTVHGIVRRSSTFNTDRIEHIYRNPNLFLHYGDVTDGSRMADLIGRLQPNEVYNLAAQSHVKVSFDEPVYSVNADAVGTLNVLEAIRTQSPLSKFYQASSSECFGKVQEIPQKETTPFYPRSPYACAKVYSHWQTVNYRESYGIFACSGLLFNHESPRRGETFVTRKITRAATRIYCGLQKKLYLGNLDAKRDWGFAGDYVKAMWLMLQQDKPDDFVISTNETHTVEEFVERTFSALDMDWRQHVEIDDRYKRPAEVDLLLGDSTKARKVLGWQPSVSFPELVQMMVQEDLKLAQREAKINAL